MGSVCTNGKREVADGVLEEREGADGSISGATGGALLCLQNCSWLGAQQTLQNHF
jgi:hypothetical protein